MPLRLRERGGYTLLEVCAALALGVWILGLLIKGLSIHKLQAARTVRDSADWPQAWQLRQALLRHYGPASAWPRDEITLYLVWDATAAQATWFNDPLRATASATGQDNRKLNLYHVRVVPCPLLPCSDEHEEALAVVARDCPLAVRGAKDSAPEVVYRVADQPPGEQAERVLREAGGLLDLHGAAGESQEGLKGLLCWRATCYADPSPHSFAAAVCYVVLREAP